MRPLARPALASVLLVVVANCKTEPRPISVAPAGAGTNTPKMGSPGTSTSAAAPPPAATASAAKGAMAAVPAAPPSPPPVVKEPAPYPRLIKPVLVKDRVGTTGSSSGRTSHRSTDQLRAWVLGSRQTLHARTEETPNYVYMHLGTSRSGTMWRWYVHVANGVVETRDYKRVNGLEVAEKSIERGDDIGSHDGGPVGTLNDEYVRCLDEVLTRPTKNYVLSVSIDKDGLLKSCRYNPKGCHDDCIEGVEISSVDWGR